MQTILQIKLNQLNPKLTFLLLFPKIKVMKINKTKVKHKLMLQKYKYKIK